MTMILLKSETSDLKSSTFQVMNMKTEKPKNLPGHFLAFQTCAIGKGQQ